MVKEAWFKRCGPNDLPDNFDRIIQSWDTANKPGKLNDFSVCTTWGIKDKRIFLLNVLRKRLDYPSLKGAVQDQFAAYYPERPGMDDSTAPNAAECQAFLDNLTYCLQGLCGMVNLWKRRRICDRRLNAQCECTKHYVFGAGLQSH